MKRRFAIILESAADLGAEELATLGKTFPSLEVFALRGDPTRGIGSIPTDVSHRISTKYESFIADRVHAFLSSNDFEKILFYECPSLAFVTLQVRHAHLEFLDTRIAIAPADEAPSTDLARFMSIEALKICGRIVKGDLESVRDFFAGDVPPVNDDALNPPSRITVAIPTKDRWDLLKQTIESFENQTFRDFDLLIGDDSSEPGARTEFDEWLRSKPLLRIEVLRNERTLGPGATRNALAKHAKTDFVVFFDDDNLAKPEMMETWSKLTRLPLVDAVSCAYESFYVNEEGRVDRANDVVFLGGLIGSRVDINDFGDSASLFRRSSFLKAGGFITDPMALFEDFELFLRMHMQGFEIRTIPHRLFRYRRHSEQRSNTNAIERGVECLAGTTKRWKLNFEVALTRPKPFDPCDPTLGWLGLEPLAN